MGTVGTAWGCGGATLGVLVGPVWGTTFLGVSVNAPVCEDTVAVHMKSKESTLET